MIKKSCKLAATIIIVSSINCAVAWPHPSGPNGGSLVTKKECREMRNQADSGVRISQVEKLRTASIPDYISGGVMEYYTDASFPFKNELKYAVNEWNEKLEGKVRIIESAEKNGQTVKITHLPGKKGSVMGTAYVNRKEIEIYLENNLYPSATKGVIAHEIGHMLGLEHGCSETLMAGPRDNISYSVTALDAAAVLQDRF